MIHEFTISNGLKVIGVESHKSPVVSVQMWVRNGSADERTGDEGLSHFIEHLVFKGSRQFKVGEIAAVVEACGGEINAYTSFDQTVYYVTISSQFFDTALKVISEMMGYPEFDGDEIDREREVVLEEIKRGNDSLGRQASRQLFSSLYQTYPYAVPVIGYENIIRSIPRERIVEFFGERYVPDNMFLVVTGSFGGSELKTKVESYFAAMAKKPVKLPPRPPMSMIDRRKVVVEKTTFEESVLYIAWPGIDIQHEDLAALECLALILGQGASSRLLGALRLRKPITNSIGAGVWAPVTQGFFSISASLNPENISEALECIKHEMELLFQDGVHEDELKKAKINFMADEAYSLETVGGLARKFGGNFELTGNIHFHEKFQAQLQAVRAADVMRVGRKYLDPNKALLSCLTPRNENEIKQMLEGWSFKMAEPTSTTAIAAVAAKPFIAKKDQTTSETIDKWSTAEGMRNFALANNAAPVFHMRLAALGGSRIVPEEQAGLAELAGRTWTAQTKIHQEMALKSRVDSLASSVYAFSGRNTFGVVVDGLSDFQKDLSELFIEVLQQRDISGSILEREKKVLLEALRSRKDSPSHIASLNFQKMMFEGHPYSVDAVGNEQTLKNISPLDIEKYIFDNLVAPKAVSTICGDFDKALWDSHLKKASAGFCKVNPKEPTFTAKTITENRYQFEKAEKEQTHVIYGFRGLSLLDKDRYALQVVEAILAGQGGRLFLELRDKASLAYSVSPMRMEGIGTGYFATYIGCSPEKTETALKMMQEELMKLVDVKVGGDEMSRAKNYLIGGHDIGLQKNSSIASAIAFNEIYGLPAEEIFDYSQHITKVTAEEVQAVSKKLFTQKSVISVVGPREPKMS